MSRTRSQSSNHPSISSLSSPIKISLNSRFPNTNGEREMGSVKVYGPPVSTAVSRVLACLLEKEVDFHLLPLSLSKAQHKSPDFLKLQPFGQVPAFQDGTTTLFESRAICRYLCDKYFSNGNSILMGGKSQAPEHRASVDQWLEAESQNFNPPASSLVFQLLFAPQMKIKQDPAAIRDGERRLRKVLDVYERRLGESRFLAGEEFSLADLSHLPNAHYIVTATDRGRLFTSRENVGRWWREISSRPSWKKVLDMHAAAAAVAAD